MKSSEIRNKFLKYFNEKEHKVLPGASLIPTDPTVLLTLAGMLQFKPIFLGIEKPRYKRAATVQKCIRMNDIENVGRTSRHHTFFEMLGNFSFGDYFKKDAIAFAWELLTKGFSLSSERLMIAVYEKDDEAYRIWNKDMNVPAEKIFKLGEDNNFWAAGATGPCGPCSEIYYDLGPSRGCGKSDCSPGCDCDRFLEIWNLVFIQYNRNEEGKLLDLPSKNIDTGMGLERIASILQAVQTNFGTDLFKPIIENLESYIKINDEKLFSSKRIIADHIRAITHLIADQLTPSNEGRGYVLRRLIRRAVRHGKLLGINDPFLYKLASVVVDINGPFYKELKKESRFISQTIKMEEDHFKNTLEQGIDILGKIISGGASIISGKDVFLLHDTYGFPVDLTREIALEKNVRIDDEGFKRLMEEQKKMGRSSGISAASKHLMDKFVDLPPTIFSGYTSLSTQAKVASVDDNDGLVVLDKTVFYPESGGQVGDTGKIISGTKECEIIGTYGAIGGLIIHKVKNCRGIKPHSSVKASVDAGKRKASSIHHTATHLLHAALRELFGKGVKQAGSHVSPQGFRFDFSHFGGISKDDLEKLERRVNDLIKEKLKVEVSELPLEEAQEKGALMFFGEKYGEKVRMIKIGQFSLELCGGTHIKNTSEISLFKIVSENSISAGIRRIEAIAGDAAKQHLLSLACGEWDKNKLMFGKYETLELKKEFLEGKPETYYQFFRITTEEVESIKKLITQGNIFLVNRIMDDFRKKNEGLAGRIDELGKELEKENLMDVITNLDKYLKNAIDIKGVKVIRCDFRHYSSDMLRKIADIFKSKVPTYAAMMFSLQADKVALLVSISDDLVARGLDAGSIAKAAAQVLGGGGGGKRSIAEAGGKDASRIDACFERVLEEIKGKI